MSDQRENIAEALLALLAGAYAWKIHSRRLKLFESLENADMPAMFLVSHGEVYQPQGEHMPMRRVLDFGVYIYFNAADEAVPDSVCNEILTAIDAAMATNLATPTITLGGLVSHCWVEGQLVKVPADIDGGVGMAIVPVKVLMP